MVTVHCITLTGIPLYDYGLSLVLAPTLIWIVPLSYLKFYKGR